MKGLLVPAAYVPYVEAELARLVERISLDNTLRTDADPRTAALAMVPTGEVLVGVQGRVTIMLVGGRDATSLAAVEPAVTP